MRICKECGIDISHKLLRRKFCSRSCSSKDRMRNGLSEKLTKSKLGKPRPDQSKRMLESNPMSSFETRVKVSNTLKSIGHCPKVRGGNGRGLTSQQLTLFKALTARWPMYHFQCEFPIKTKKVRDFFSDDDRVPTCYKPDIICHDLDIVIEIDGPSHNSLERKRQDEKKTYCLHLLGFEVIRITNKEVETSLEQCLKKFQEKIL